MSPVLDKDGDVTMHDDEPTCTDSSFSFLFMTRKSGRPDRSNQRRLPEEQRPCVKGAEVFAVPELLEMIMLALPPKDVLLLQRVSSTWRDVVRDSGRLREKLFCKPMNIADLIVLRDESTLTKSERYLFSAGQSLTSKHYLRREHVRGVPSVAISKGSYPESHYYRSLMGNPLLFDMRYLSKHSNANGGLFHNLEVDQPGNETLRAIFDNDKTSPSCLEMFITQQPSDRMECTLRFPADPVDSRIICSGCKTFNGQALKASVILKCCGINACLDCVCDHLSNKPTRRSQCPRNTCPQCRCTISWSTLQRYRDRFVKLPMLQRAGGIRPLDVMAAIRKWYHEGYKEFAPDGRAVVKRVFLEMPRKESDNENRLGTLLLSPDDFARLSSLAETSSSGPLIIKRKEAACLRLRTRD